MEGRFISVIKLFSDTRCGLIAVIETFASIKNVSSLFRLTTCLENLEMSGNMTAVREMSGILLKIRELSEKKSCQGKVA